MNKSLVLGLVCSLAAGFLVAGGVAGAEMSFPPGQTPATIAEAANAQTCVAGVFGGVDLAGFGKDPSIGTGNGHIHIIPALSAKSVKNGDRVRIQAVVKALDGVAKVEARIERENDGLPSGEISGLLGLAVDTLELAGTPLNLGGAKAAGTTGVWQAEWSATGLEEGYYRVAVTVTDKTGRTHTDRSLLFTDPIGGNNAVGSSAYPNGGMRRLDKATLSGGTLFRCATADTATGYAYFATDTSPGTIVKVALGAGATPPAQVASLTLNAGDDRPSCVVIDTANSYAYFGTYTLPGRVVKVSLGAGVAAPTRVGAVSLNGGEDYLTCATGNAASGYALFGTDTSPARVVKVAMGAGGAAPTRASGLLLPSGENMLRSAVSDLAEGYAYFGTNTSPGRVVKVAIGAGAAAPTWVGTLGLNGGENMLTSAVADVGSNYAYFGTNTAPGLVVKVALGTGAALPTRVGTLTLNAGESLLSSARLDLGNGHAYFGAGTSPGVLVKVALGTGAALPTRVGALTLNTGENNLDTMLLDLSAGCAYLGTYASPGAIVRAGLSQKGFLKATKFTMTESGGVGSVSLYSHAASGSVRLALYDNSPNPALVWESASTANSATNAWLTVPIAAGAPSSLLLSAGDYWLAWQVDVTTPVASWAAGVSGEGLFTPMLYGASPYVLNAGTSTAPTLTDERWSEYITYWAPPATPSNPGVLIPPPAVNDITRNSIPWKWADNSNDETGFQVYADPDPVNPPVTLQTITAANTTSWTQPGLSSNTLYAFQVCATNLYGNSARTSTYTAWTLASQPSAPAVGNATLNSLDVTLGADINPAGTLYSIWFLPGVGGNSWVQADGTAGPFPVARTAAEWGTTKVKGLSPSTAYNFYVRAQNGAGRFTSYSPTSVGTTLAAVPLAPTVGNAYVHTLDVTLNAGTNSLSTLYAIQVIPDVGGNTWIQADGSVGSGSVYQTLGVWGTKTITGLSASRTYSFVVGAKNTAGVYTAFGPQGSGATLAALSITVNPVGGSVYVGDSFPLSVATSGGRAPLAYQWQKGGTGITGATLPSLPVSPAALIDSGTYTCRVRDAGTEDVLSGEAALAVAEHVSITAPPVGGTAYAGAPYTLTVGASGGIGTLTYQWQKNGADISGKTLDTLSFASLASVDAAAYSCRVRDTRTDNELSAEAVLAVADHVSITTPPAGVSAYTGSTHTFTIGVSGGIGTLTYQWYKDGAEISGATLDSLELTNLAAGDAAAYTCRVRDAVADDVLSPDAALAVADHLSIMTPPAGGSAYAGDPFDFTVGVSGGIGTLTYQWYKDGVEITDATLNTLSFPGLVTGDTAAYSCRVRDALTDDVLSPDAALAVSEHVSFTPPPAGGSAYIGGAYTFTAGVSGGIGTLTYQWYKDGAEITDATLDSLSLSGLTAGDAAAYSCRARDAVTDNVLSPEAVLAVAEHTVITAQTGDGSAYVGDPYTLMVEAVGGIGTLTYQWQKDGIEIPGATLDTLHFESLTMDDSATFYTCRVRDAMTDDILSADTALAVSEHVSFTPPPAGGFAYIGDAYTFSVGVSGGIGALTYQWYKDGAEITDATFNTLDLTNLAAGDAAAYTCRVRDAVTDDVLSPDAVLATADRISIAVQPENQTVSEGDTATLTVTAAGGFAPLHYRWMKGGTSMPGSPDAPELVIKKAAFGDAGDYSVEVYDSQTDSIASNAATLEVVNGVPVAGALGLAALALAAALGGVRTLRRK